MIFRAVMLGSILFCSTAFAQNWQLFPKDQLSHYLTGNNPYEVRSFLADSARISGNGELHYFRRHLGFSDTCYWQNKEWLYPFSYDNFSIDSLLYLTDSVIFYFTDGGTVFDFIFWQNAKSGEEWDLSSHLSRKGMCTGISTADVNGVTDSVKTYTLESAIYGDVEFVLSRKYGLLQFIPFTDFFLQIPDKTDIPYYQLAGFRSGSENRGFHLPVFSDFFHLSPGDLQLWEHHFWDDTGYTTNYYLDSIMVTSIYPDSVVYQISRSTYDVNGTLIGITQNRINNLRAEYEIMLNTPRGWIITKDALPYSDIFRIDAIYLDCNASDTVIYISCSSLGSCIFTWYGEQCSIVCLDKDYYSYEYRFSTREGLTCFDGIYGNIRQLLGSRIDGITYGTLEIPVSLNDIKYCYIGLYPNPTSGILHIPEDVRIRKIEVFNYLGTRVSIQYSNNNLDFTSQPSGFYEVVIQNMSDELYSQPVLIIW